MRQASGLRDGREGHCNSYFFFAPYEGWATKQPGASPHPECMPVNTYISASFMVVVQHPIGRQRRASTPCSCCCCSSSHPTCGAREEGGRDAGMATKVQHQEQQGPAGQESSWSCRCLDHCAAAALPLLACRSPTRECCPWLGCPPCCLLCTRIGRGGTELMRTSRDAFHMGQCRHACVL